MHDERKRSHGSMMPKMNTPAPDVLAWPLAAAETRLRECAIAYTLEETLAPSKKPKSVEGPFDRYVVKQDLSLDGTNHLTVCLKLRKEVL